MAQAVKWTEAARRDLEQAAIYIAEDSRFYAATFVREVLDASRSLAHFSNRGRVVPEFTNTMIRELLVRRYRLIYQEKGQTIHIIGLVHGARDLATLWEQEKRPSS